MQISFQSSNEADEEQGKRHAKQESKHSKQKNKQLGQLLERMAKISRWLGYSLLMFEILLRKQVKVPAHGLFKGNVTCFFYKKQDLSME